MCSKYLEQDISLPEEEIIEFTRKIVKRANCYFRVLVRVVFFANTLSSLKVSVTTVIISLLTLSFFLSVSLVHDSPISGILYHKLL